MGERFRAYRIFNEDGRVGGRLVEMSPEELDDGDVLIRSAYSSLSYKDALAGTGAGKIARRFPIVGGVSVAGEVAESSDPRFEERDKVVVTGFGMSEDHDGGYAEWVRVPAGWVVPLPEGLSEWEAMAIGTAGLTAALSILRMEENGLRPENGPVVVTGATGGVGSFSIDLLSQRGYEVVAITGKDHEHDYLRRLGAKEVISRHTLEMSRRPLEKARWAGAVDTAGGEMLAWLTRTMLTDGNIASSGLVGGVELNTTVMPFILRRVNLLGINLGSYPMKPRRKLWELLAGEMRPRYLREISHSITLDELPEVFDRFLKGTVRGRIVVDIASG